MYSIPQSPEDAVKLFATLGLNADYAKRFYNHYAAYRWQYNGVPLNIDRAVETWRNNALPTDQIPKVINTPPPPDPYKDLAPEDAKLRREAVRDLRELGPFHICAYINDSRRLKDGKQPQHIWDPVVEAEILRLLPLIQRFKINYKEYT